MSAPRTVLVADDDDDVRHLIALALARGALAVVRFTDIGTRPGSPSSRPPRARWAGVRTAAYGNVRR